MIRKIAGFLCMVMMLSGCSGSLNTSSDKDIERVAVEQEVNTLRSEFPLVWKEATEYADDPVEFVPTQYTPKVPKYQVAPDLSNIQNLKRFYGFSEEQIKLLSQNGFVVLDPNPDKAHYYMKMYDIYEENEYKQIPNFVTVDVALHIYHKFFGETLKGIEKEKLFQALQQLTDHMLQKSLQLYHKAENESVKKDLAHTVIYFSVANQLINRSYGDIPRDLKAIAQKEIEEIENVTGYSKSPLFGFDINYEQFVVRGHYAGDEVLEAYFKTMMWYGLVGHPFYDEGQNIDYESTARSLLITYIAFLELDGNNDIALWDKIYAPTNFFVGQSDDITLFDLKEVIQKVYGENASPQAFKDEAYHAKLKEAIDQLPEPQIRHKLITGAVDTPVDKQFRFMGQRYTLDANILQELMVPILRPVPTGLDVAAAFGNERAEVLAKEKYLHKLAPEKYSSELSKLKDKVESLTEKDWQKNLYNGWLWVLKSVWTAKDSMAGLPFFMTNQPWQDKNIQTGLGSYAELKHDTVLYAKQPAAEMGGGEEVQEYYPNYVEPAVEVYDRLLWLVKYSRVNLLKRGLLSDNGDHALKELERIYELFRTCAVKQLENTPLTEDEDMALKRIGGTLEFIHDTLANTYNQSLSSAVISDVAGIADVGMFLEIGTGLPSEMLVAVTYEGKVYLARGAVYSYYEFLSEKPLTDQEWHEQLGIERVEEEEWHYERINPELLFKNAPPQPKWIQSFKFKDKNQVNMTLIEYNINQ